MRLRPSAINAILVRMKAASRLTTMPTISVPRQTEPVRRLWTRREYYRIAAEGFFDGQRVELIEGEIIQMPPMLEPHANGIERTRRILEAAFGSSFWVRIQMPLHLRRRSAPEPDLAVVRGGPGSYRTAPTSALLLAEVSDTSLAFDRGRKASLYASAGIADYWIVNLVHDVLEVHRSPVQDRTQFFNYRYADVRTLLPGENVVPLAAPKARIRVANLLP
jgi:Uma2 family endonuclease